MDPGFTGKDGFGGNPGLANELDSTLKWTFGSEFLHYTKWVYLIGRFCQILQISNAFQSTVETDKNEPRN